MLTILLNWIYVLFTTFCAGFAFACFVEKVFGYRLKRLDSVLVSGLVIATVYAQIFSLFYKVGLAANAGMLLMSLVICAVAGRKMSVFLKNAMQETTVIRKILIAVLFLAWGYFTSRGYMVYDSSLYHGQSIRWIEEYGVVKGLGTLHERFAYNSSIFSLTALYSMKFLVGRSLHTMDGYVAFLLSITLLDLGNAFHRKKMLLSDYASVAAVYYLTTVCDEIIAPSSDYVSMCMIFYIVIKWLRTLESEEKEEIVPYALLCVCGVFAISLKLTAGLILLLLIKPAAMLLKQKKWRDICLYLLMGFLVAVPWLTRNVIISGWLLYPFPQLDLFSFDWKIHNKELIQVDADQIKVWARGLYQIALVDLPITRWFGNWFRTELFMTERLLILADMTGCLFTVGYGIFLVFKKKWACLDTLLVLATVGASYLYWQFSAPMMRYGYAYVLLLAAIPVGIVLQRLKIAKIVYAAFIGYGLYKLYVTGAYMISCAPLPNYIWQETYENTTLEEAVTYEISGVTFYAPKYGDRIGYELFPSSPIIQNNLELRGNDLKDGFREVMQ